MQKESLEKKFGIQDYVDIIDEIWCSPQLDFKGRAKVISK
jgi:hypothetical protein